MSSHKADASEHEAEAIELAMVINEKRKKAFLALLFAGGIIAAEPPLPASAENKVAQTDDVIQHLVHNAAMKPEVRAANLLRLAWLYLTETPIIKVEMQFYNLPADAWFLSNPEKWESSAQGWADLFSTESLQIASVVQTRTNQSQDSKSDSKQRLNLANTAVQQAVTQLDIASGDFAKLNMYFIASKLFEKIGNLEGMKKCNKVLESAVLSCERNKEIDFEQIRAAASVLNLRANELVSIRIQDPTYPWYSPVKQKPFTQKDFEDSERLKLKAANILDRLPNTEHVKRKAHRDLALWYKELGKKDKAEQQKQILFKLVGAKDDNILYPQKGRCGHLVWWETSRRASAGACGMG